MTAALPGPHSVEKVNAYAVPTSVLIPKKAISVISAAGQPFHDPEADQALFETLAAELRDDIPVEWHECEINGAEFGEACVTALLKNLSQAKSVENQTSRSATDS